MLSDQLLEKDTLDLKMIIGIIGKRPFSLDENLQKYLEVD